MKLRYRIAFWLLFALVLLWGWNANAGMPSYVNAGALTGSANAVTPALPTGIALNDVLLLPLETANQDISIANQNGGDWVQLPNSPQGTGASGTRLTMFGCRYNGTQGNPTTTDSGDHQIGVIIAYRGVVTSGDPWNITSGGTDTGPATLTLTGATTDSNNCMIILVATHDLDQTAAVFSNWTNANLSSITERVDEGNRGGNGGGIGIAEGQYATAGNYGNSTVTQDAAVTLNGWMTVALEGAIPALVTGPPNYVQSPRGPGMVQSVLGGSKIQGR